MHKIRGAICYEGSIRKLFQHPKSYTFVFLTKNYYVVCYDVVTLQQIGRSLIPIWNIKETVLQDKNISKPQPQKKRGRGRGRGRGKSKPLDIQKKISSQSEQRKSQKSLEDKSLKSFVRLKKLKKKSSSSLDQLADVQEKFKLHSNQQQSSQNIKMEIQDEQFIGERSQLQKEYSKMQEQSNEQADQIKLQFKRKAVDVQQICRSQNMSSQKKEQQQPKLQQFSQNKSLKKESFQAPYESFDQWFCIFTDNFNIFFLFGKNYLFKCQVKVGQIKVKKFICPFGKFDDTSYFQLDEQRTNLPKKSLIIGASLNPNENIVVLMNDRIWILDPRCLLVHTNSIDYVKSNKSKKKSQQNPKIQLQQQPQGIQIKKIKKQSKSQRRQKFNLPQNFRELLRLKKQRSNNILQTIRMPLIKRYFGYPNNIIIQTTIQLKQNVWLAFNFSLKLIYVMALQEDRGIKICCQFQLSQIIDCSNVTICLCKQKKFFSLYNEKQVAYFCINTNFEISYIASTMFQSPTKLCSMTFFTLGVNTSAIDKYTNILYGVCDVQKNQSQCFLEIYRCIKEQKKLVLEHILQLDQQPISPIFTNAYLDNHILYYTNYCSSQDEIGKKHNIFYDSFSNDNPRNIHIGEIQQLKMLNIINSCSSSTRVSSNLKNYESDILGTAFLGAQWVCLSYKFQFIEKNQIYEQKEDEFDIQTQQKTERTEQQKVKFLEQLDDWSQSLLNQKTYWSGSFVRLDYINFDKVV